MNFTEEVLSSFPAARTALVAVDEYGERKVWGFGELAARAAGLAGALQARGIGRGDVVITLIGNRSEWVLSMLACFRIGAVALPCNTQLRPADLAYRIAVANPAIALGEERYLENLPGGVAYMTLDEIHEILDEERPQAPPAAAADLDPDDPALIVFTSGNDRIGPGGRPPPSVPDRPAHPGRALVRRARRASSPGARPRPAGRSRRATRSSRPGSAAPPPTSTRAGSTPPSGWRSASARGSTSSARRRPSTGSSPGGPSSGPIGSLRRLVSAGEPLNAEVIRAFREEMGMDIHDGYGQTETGALTGALTDGEVRDGSMGLPLPGIDVRIDEGELVLRAETCPTFFSHYIGSEPFAEEWWRTGDLVTADDDGYLWFEGRTDDVILSSGYRIGPFEVESALLTHPAVSEAAAVAAPDPERGSVVRAVVVLRSGEPGDALAAELQEHVKRETAPYKYPRIVEFADALPKTASGKIKRAELRGDGPAEPS